MLRRRVKREEERGAVLVMTVIVLVAMVGICAIVVDLGRPRRLSSDAVGLLLWLHAACLERGVTVVVTGPPRRGVGPLWRSGLLTPRADRAPAHPHSGGAHA